MTRICLQVLTLVHRITFILPFLKINIYICIYIMLSYIYMVNALVLLCPSFHIGFILNSVYMCGANGVLLNLWLWVSWLLLHNLFHMPYSICNSYSIKSLYFSGFSMTPFLSREPEPIWFAGMPSQQKNLSVLIFAWPRSCMTMAGFLYLWGQVQPILLLPKPSPGSPHDTFGHSLLLWMERSNP